MVMTGWEWIVLNTKFNWGKESCVFVYLPCFLCDIFLGVAVFTFMF